MRAALIDPRAGRLVLSEVPDPAQSPHQLLIRVRAAGVNRADLAMIAGQYSGPTATPFVAGGELAGEVLEVGSAVTSWRVGDRAMALGQGYAELAVVDAALAWLVAASLDIVVAGALPAGLATMHDALFTNGRFTAGEHVVVTAASSGVGVVGVRMALHAGAATVIGTSRSADKRQQLTDLVGDDRFVAIAPEDLVVRTGTAQERNDVIQRAWAAMAAGVTSGARRPSPEVAVVAARMASRGRPPGRLHTWAIRREGRSGQPSPPRSSTGAGPLPDRAHRP